MRHSTLFMVLVAAFAFACGVSHPIDGGDAGPPDIPEPGRSAEALIGSEGGSIELGSFIIDVPAGALASATMITVEVTNEVVGAPFVAYSPVFRFGPAGLSFDTPINVRIPFAGDEATATIYWTVDESGSYAALDTTIEGGLAVADAEHFSRAFVGSACSGAGCCGRGRGTLDVLLAIDNSNSMAEEQASLAAEIPRLARVLATGDLDGDGVQDFPALRSVRIGTVTSDMGTGGYTVPTCALSDFGDDGILVTEGNTDLGCAATYPGWAELGAGATDAEINAFVDQVSCTAQVGIGGCGFEQQLEGVIKAVTSSSSTTTFHAGSAGHGDTTNLGFLRPDSVLATIVLTDENDCSAADPAIFDPVSPAYGATDLNLRCFAHASTALHPVSRYADALRATRADPADVVFGLVAGVPVDLAGADPATILADPRMIETIDPSTGNRLLPSCDVAGRGLAFPPTRMVELADAIDASTVQSICQEDFTPVVDAILTQVAARVSGTCAP